MGDFLLEIKSICYQNETKFNEINGLGKSLFKN